MFKLFDIRNSLRIDPDTPDQKYIQRYFRPYGGGHFVKRADGKLLVTYTKLIGGEQVWSFAGTVWAGGNRCIVLSVVDSFSDLFGASNIVVDNEWVFYNQSPFDGTNYYNSFNLSHSYFLKVPNVDPLKPDSILLFIFEPGGHFESYNIQKVLCYRSLNGLGTDFTLLSTINEQYPIFNSYVGPRADGARPIYLSDVGAHGRIIATYVRHKPAVWLSGAWYNWRDSAFAYSDDRGASWNYPVTPLGGQALLYRPGQINGIAAFGSGGSRQIVGISSDGYGMGGVRYIVSTDDGVTWSRSSDHGRDPEDEEDPPALPYTNSSSSVWKIGTHLYDGDDDYNYVTACWSDSNYSKWRLYRRLKSSPLDLGSAPDISSFEGPLHPNFLGDDNYETYWGMAGDYPQQFVHVVAVTSHAGSGAISYGYHAGSFKFAIAGMYDTVIRSTFPFVVIMIIFALDLGYRDYLHFKLQSSKETVDSQTNPEKFGYSMDGGSSWVSFPPDGVPAVNPYNLLIAVNIEVEPGNYASLIPSAKVLAGVGSSEAWWMTDIEKRTEGWWSLGSVIGERGDPWEPIFEHEVTGLPEEEPEE